MQRIYVLLTRTNTVLARSVRRVTGTEYSHSSIAFDNMLYDMCSFARKYPRNPFIGRLVRENINEGLFLKNHFTDCLVFTALIQDDEYKAIRDYISSIRCSKKLWKFNNIGLIGCWFDKVINRKYKRCCSQFVGEALSLAPKSIQLPRNPMTMRPNDFRKTKGLTLIYSGRMCDIPLPFDEDNLTPVEDRTLR